jgi:lysozyme
VPVTLKGIDVSESARTVDWDQVKASGRTFGVARISDGLTKLDANFQDYWPAIKRAGLVRGAYQYFRARHGGAEQADMVLKQISAAGGLSPGDLPPVLDLETADGQSAHVVVSRAQAFLDRIESKLGVKPIVYTGNNMSSTIGTAFKDYVLWVPHYKVPCPRIPKGWSTWTIWQDNGDVTGVTGVDGDADTDFFNGTRADLDALTLTQAFNEPAAPDAAPSPADDENLNGVMGDSFRTPGAE